MYGQESSHQLSTYKRPRCVEPVTASELLQRRQQRRLRLRGPRPRPGDTAPVSLLPPPPVALLQNPEWELPSGSLTELAGPAGAGKTQLALTLCVDTVLLQQHAVYLSLGGNSQALSRIAHRLEAMLQARSQPNPSVTPVHIRQWLSRIFVKWIRNPEELLELVQTSLPALLRRHPTIQVVVFDGVANLFRSPLEAGAVGDMAATATMHHYQARATTFFQWSALCKQLADCHAVSFLLINQATTRIRGANEPPKKKHSSSSSLSSSSSATTTATSQLVPALGLSWSQCVQASLFLTRLSTHFSSNKGDTVVRRRLECRRSPWLASLTRMDCYIDRRGAVRIKE